MSSPTLPNVDARLMTLRFVSVFMNLEEEKGGETIVKRLTDLREAAP